MHTTYQNGADAIARAAEVWNIEAQSVSDLAGRIDREAFFSTMKLLDGAARVALTGAGTSAQAAKKIAHTLSCVDVPAYFLSPSDAVHGGLGVVTARDVAVLISKGGNTREITALLPGLAARNVPIVAVTENRESEIGRAATVVLEVRVEKEPDRFNMLATASTAAVVAVFDALAIVLMEHRGFTMDQFLTVHPGGAVGERLKDQKGERT